MMHSLTVLELLAALLFIVFGTYGSHIENDTHSTDLTPNGMNESVTKVIDNSTHAADEKLNTESASTTVPPMQDIESAKNNPCIYTENGYKCCRNFHVSLVHSSQTGVQYTLEGCAILEYLQKNKLSMQLNIGKEFSNNTVTVRGSGKTTEKTCMNVLEGSSTFCGQIYLINKDNNQNYFKVCLGLELRSGFVLEASQPVSCFRSGPRGLKLLPPEPLPTLTESHHANSNENDDFDIFGLFDDSESDNETEDDEENNDLDFPGLNDLYNYLSGNDGDDDDDDGDDDDLF